MILTFIVKLNAYLIIERREYKKTDKDKKKLLMPIPTRQKQYLLQYYYTNINSYSRHSIKLRLHRNFEMK